MAPCPDAEKHKLRYVRCFRHVRGNLSTAHNSDTEPEAWAHRNFGALLSHMNYI